MSTELEAYATDLQQAILLEADIEGAEQLRPEVFTRHLIDILIEAGEVEDAAPIHHRARGVEVHGYGVDDDDTLNLIATLYRGEVPPGTVTQTDLNTAFRRLWVFWERCRDGPYHEGLEPSSDAYDMAMHIHNVSATIRRVRMFAVTDAKCSADRLTVHTEDGIEQRRTVWDIERLQRLETSGQQREPIEIDFVERFGRPLSCLSAGTGQEDYDAMLAVVPGPWLAEIYDEYGARLLELNVRSFLQATGKVNRGIRDTLRQQPERFLAYNNGISATASHVELEDPVDGGVGIRSIRDLQIVNGGQTTASVHRAMTTGVDLTAVSVQAKITVVAPERLDEIVPLISRFANSQNKVSEADLRANDPFHVALESLSRTVWTPGGGDELRQTRWFYERARGQYRDAMSMAGTPARQRAWKLVHPNTQRFQKTDVAKYENAWSLLPHEVSRGAQKNFTVFMGLLAQRPTEPTIDYFRRLVAKALLWKRTEQLVSDQKFGGYRANLVAYAIAKLSHATSQRVDLLAIWDRQKLDDELEAAIVELSHLAWGVLVDGAPAGSNITEWAKQERCWQKMREQPWRPSTALQGTLASTTTARQATVTGTDDPAVEACLAVPAAHWGAMAAWGKETGKLADWQRTTTLDISRRLKTGRPPTPRQAEFGVRILTDARSRGFVPDNASIE